MIFADWSNLDGGQQAAMALIIVGAIALFFCGPALYEALIGGILNTALKEDKRPKKLKPGMEAELARIDRDRHEEHRILQIRRRQERMSTKRYNEEAGWIEMRYQAEEKRCYY